MVETSSLNNFKSSLDKHWYKRSFSFHYDIDAFEEFCSEFQGSGFSGQLSTSSQEYPDLQSSVNYSKKAIKTITEKCQ